MSDHNNRRSLAAMKNEMLEMTGVQADEFVRGAQAALRWAIGMSDTPPHAGIRDQLPRVYPRQHDGGKVPQVMTAGEVAARQQRWVGGPVSAFPLANPGEAPEQEGRQLAIEDVPTRAGLVR